MGKGGEVEESGGRMGDLLQVLRGIDAPIVNSVRILMR